jgi:hypothetical protein
VTIIQDLPAPAAGTKISSGEATIDRNAPPPLPTIVVARRLPEEERPSPPSPSSRKRSRLALPDEPDDENDVSDTLRSVVRDVVGDIADHRDGKR